MNSKNAKVMLVIVQVLIYLILITLPISKSDGTLTTSKFLLNLIVDDTNYAGSSLLIIIAFLPYICLILSTILMILYLNDKTEDNLKKLKIISLFLIGLFIFELVFSESVRYFARLSSYYKPTIAPFLTLALTFVFAFFVFWKSQKENLSMESEQHEQLNQLDKNKIFGLIFVGVLIILAMWGQNSVNKSFENYQNNNGLDGTRYKFRETLISLFDKLPDILKILFIIVLSAWFSYYCVSEFKKYVLEKK
jgi:hypothetical protein